MPQCPECNARYHGGFSVCEKCDVPLKPIPAKRSGRPVKCVYCAAGLEFMGTKEFHEGGGTFFFTSKLWEGREVYDVYACPSCGHIGMFIHDVGNE